MADNETGILVGFRGGLEDGHVLNVIKRKGNKFADFEDCQTINNFMNLKKHPEGPYIEFKYMKTN